MNTEHLPQVIQILGMMVAFVAVIFLYWVPSMVASNRHHRDVGAISIINLFLGWTFIGWVIALAWACSGNTKEGK